MTIKLEDAVAIVQKEIRKWREKYESVANENGQDHPIMVEGETTAGYFCQLMVNPQEVAKIFVDYDYALYRVLGEDAPDAMWEDLGRKFGLEHVCSVDLWINNQNGKSSMILLGCLINDLSSPITAIYLL